MLTKLLTAIVLTVAPAAAEDIPSTIIAMERSALDRSYKGDVNGFLEISAPDVVYQDPALTAPLIGLPALTAYYAKFPAGGEPSHGEMSSAHVQSLGDVAVLSFHYVSGANTKTPKWWNCTEVYRKTAGAWRIVNTHWSLTNPMPQKFQ